MLHTRTMVANIESMVV